VTGPAARPDQGREDSAQDLAEDRADWIRDIDTALAAAGLTTRLNQTAAGFDVTAALHPSGDKPADVVVDEDGYVELRWWSDPGATPRQVAAVITSALAAVTPAATRSART
jgi:hypothetical protein